MINQCIRHKVAKFEVPLSGNCATLERKFHEKIGLQKIKVHCVCTAFKFKFTTLPGKPARRSRRKVNGKANQSPLHLHHQQQFNE